MENNKFYNINSPSRKNSVKVLTIGGYLIMSLDVIQSLLFVPLYLMYIGDRIYGLWLATGGVLAILSFFDIGIASLTIQRISKYYSRKDYDKIFYSFISGLIINLFFLFLLLLFGFTFSHIIVNFFSLKNSYESEILMHAFRLGLISLFFSLLNNTVEGSINALQKPTLPVIFQFIGGLLGIIVTYFMLFSENPLLGLPLGLLVRSSFSLILNFIYIFVIFIKNKIQIRLIIPKSELKYYINVSPNLIFAKFGSSIVTNIEPVLITKFISPEVNVAYSITKKLISFMRLFLDKIGGILYPSLSHLYHEKSKKEFSSFFIKLIGSILPICMLSISFNLIVNHDFIKIWVGDEFYLGDTITLLLSFGIILNFLSNFLGYLLSITGDFKYASNMVFFESIIKLFLFYISIKYFGIIGLLFSLSIISFIFIIIYLIRWKKFILIDNIDKIKFKNETTKTILLYLLITLVLSYVSSYIYIVSFFHFCIFFSLTLIFIGLSIFLNFYIRETIRDYLF